MKKLFLFLLLSVLVLTLVTGCGDDDDNGTTDPTFDNLDDMEYILAVGGDMFGRSEYDVIIGTNTLNGMIETVELTINGDEIYLENMMGSGIYVGVVNGEVGDQLACEVDINGTMYELDLKISGYPYVNWPENFDPSMSYDLEWTLDADSQYQVLSGYGETFDWETWETIAEDDKYVELSPSARSYTIPANWLDSGLEDYDLSLDEISFDFDSKLAGVSSTSNYQEYWSRSDEEKDSNYMKIVKRYSKILEMYLDK